MYIYAWKTRGSKFHYPKAGGVGRTRLALCGQQVQYSNLTLPTPNPSDDVCSNCIKCYAKNKELSYLKWNFQFPE